MKHQVLVVLAMFLSACSTTVATPVPAVPTSVSPDIIYTSPGKTDTGGVFAGGAQVPLDMRIYELNVTLVNLENHTEINGASSSTGHGNYYSSSSRLWQDGKGLAAVRVNSIHPDIDEIPVNSTVILKTTDLKIMGLPEGATFELKCRWDTEVIAPMMNYETLTENYLTFELDYCRMITPLYK